MVTQVAEWVSSAERIAVLTGAGISTDSGIPDFRGPQGLWTRDPGAQRLFSLAAYGADSALRREAWQRRLAHEAWTAEPNAGHRALVDLEATGRLTALVTQNIDGLHQRAGSSEDLVLEIHGTLWQVECLGCERRTPMKATLERVRAGDPDPACLDCGGLLKSATVAFGQSLDAALLARAEQAAESCDVFLAIGTSLTVHPVAGLCDVAGMAGARLVIVNASPTPYDEVADAVVREPISEVLPGLVRGV